MTLTFNLKRSSTKSKRTHKKFPRYKFKDFNTIPKNLKEWGYCKHNWNDDDYTYVAGDIKKFLMSNLGKPINKIYSLFRKRCSNLSKFNAKDELYSLIESKDELSERVGGFYLINGILNYLKPSKKVIPTYISNIKENKKQFNQLDMTHLIKTLDEIKVPQCLGQYWIHNKKKTIYMDFIECSNFWEDYVDTDRVISSIPGVGTGLKLDIIYTVTGRAKYVWSVFNTIEGSPTIYFYFKK